MHIFPAFYPLAGRRVVVAGEGAGAEAKLRLLAGGPAQVVRLTGAAAFDQAAYHGAVLAFVASEDDAFARRAVAAARAAGIPVNATDRPALCDFTSPAVIDRGEVVAAVGTGGGSPMLAAMLRQDIELALPPGVGRLAALLQALQPAVRAALPDLPRRRAFLRSAMSGPAAEAALAGDTPAAEAALRQALADFRNGCGRVDFIDARVAADLLSLRAFRLLAAADVVAPDPDVSPQMLELSRRDAERSPPGPAERLAELAQSGLRVVRLVAKEGWRSQLEELRGLGVDVGVAPVAAG